MAAVMNGTRNQFLSGAGFAQKQHGRVAGSHGLHQLQERFGANGRAPHLAAKPQRGQNA